MDDFWVLVVCPPDEDPKPGWWRTDRNVAALQPVVVPARGCRPELPMLFRYMPNPAFFEWLAGESRYDPAEGRYRSRDAPT